MATLAEIHALAQSGHLPPLQRDAVLRIQDHRDAWEFYKLYSAQQGVQHAPGEQFPGLTRWSVANGDMGPVMPVPADWKMDLQGNWRPPSVQAQFPSNFPAAPVETPFIDPGRELQQFAVEPVAPPPPPPPPVAIQPDPVAPTPPPSVPVIAAPAPSVQPATNTIGEDAGTTVVAPAPPAPPIAPAIAQPIAKPTTQPTTAAPSQPKTMPVLDFQQRVVTDDTLVTTASPTMATPGVQQSFSLGGLVRGIGNALGGAAGGLLASGGNPLGALVGAGAAVGIGGSRGTAPTGGTPGIGGPFANVGIPGTGTTVGQVDQGLAEILAGAIPGVPGMVAQGALNMLGPATGTRAGHTAVGCMSGPELMEPGTKVIQKASPGYVLVTRDWNGTGIPTTMQVRKDVARHYGYRKPKKPPISVGEMTAINNANKAAKKLVRIQTKVSATAKDLAKAADLKCVRK